MKESNTRKLKGDWELVPEGPRGVIIEKTDDLVKILQDLQLSVAIRKNSNTLIVQNVRISTGNEPLNSSPRDFLGEVVRYANRNGNFKLLNL